MRVVFLFSTLNVLGIPQQGSTAVAVPVSTVLVDVLWDLLTFKVGRWSNRKQAVCLLFFLSGDTSLSSKIVRSICVLGILRCQERAEVPLSLLATIRKSSCVNPINLIYLCFLSQVKCTETINLILLWNMNRIKRTQQFPVPSKTGGPCFKLSDGVIIAIVILNYFILWGLFGSFNCLGMIVPILNTAQIRSFLRKNLTGIEYKNLSFKITTGKYSGSIY